MWKQHLFVPQKFTKCVTACGDCRGENCKNAEEVIFNVSEDNIDIEEVTIDQI